MINAPDDRQQCRICLNRLPEWQMADRDICLDCVSFAEVMPRKPTPPDRDADQEDHA